MQLLGTLRLEPQCASSMSSQDAALHVVFACKMSAWFLRFPAAAIRAVLHDENSTANCLCSRSQPPGYFMKAKQYIIAFSMLHTETFLLIHVVIEVLQHDAHLDASVIHVLQVDRLYYYSSIDKYISCGRDGSFRLWNAAELKHAKTVSNGSSWITDCLYMPLSRKMVFTTVDRAISYYDINR